MRMYEITDIERQQLIDTLIEQKEFSPNADVIYEALLILGYDLEYDEKEEELYDDSDESEY